MVKPVDLFDLSKTGHASLFDGCGNAWEVLPKIAAYLKSHVKPGLRNRCEGVAYIGENVFIGDGTVVEDGVMIKGPAIIGRNCQIRHNAYVRENVVIGDDCTVGNACEVKNSFFFNGAVAPHFNYVGDSVLGHKAHLGAGVKISNFKLVSGNIQLVIDGRKIDTGLRKFGALVGDHAEVGCNAVLNPGTILGKNSLVYPNINWRGYLGENKIVKNRAEQEIQERRTS